MCTHVYEVLFENMFLWACKTNSLLLSLIILIGFKKLRILWLALFFLQCGVKITKAFGALRVLRG